MYTILDELEFRPYPTTDYRVTVLVCLKKCPIHLKLESDMSMLVCSFLTEL